MEAVRQQRGGAAAREQRVRGQSGIKVVILLLNEEAAREEGGWELMEGEGGGEVEHLAGLLAERHELAQLGPKVAPGCKSVVTV